MLDYYFRSMLDADRFGLDEKALAAIDSALWARERPAGAPAEEGASGAVAIPFAEYASGALGDESLAAVKAVLPKDGPPGGADVVMVLPWVGRRAPSQGGGYSRSRRLCLPVCLLAAVSEGGGLVPAPIRPWFAREWLDGGSGDDDPFGPPEAVERFYASCPMGTPPSWRALTDAVDGLCRAVAGSGMAEMSHPDYVRMADGAAILAGPHVRGAAAHILGQYKSMAAHGWGSRLFEGLVVYRERSPEPLAAGAEAAALDRRHVGQMRGDFGLALRQREALRHLARSGPGETLAVNGPPGTGKTTFLQSVVANAFTAAAHAKARHPPVIVASSTNNTAVINILDTFRKAALSSGNGALSGRWVVGADSFGLYCPSSSAKERAARDSYPFRFRSRGVDALAAFGRDGQTFDPEGPEAVADSEREFLRRFAAWDGSPSGSVEAAGEAVWRALDANVRTQAEAMSHVEAMASALAGPPAFADAENMAAASAAAAEEAAAADGRRQSHARVLATRSASLAARPWWWTFLGWFGPVRRAVELDNARFCHDHGIAVASPARFGDAAVHETLAAESARLDSAWRSAKSVADGLSGRLARWREARSGAARAVGVGVPDDPSWDPAAELDRSLRHAAFTLAVHYWEARWICLAKEVARAKTGPAADSLAWAEAAVRRRAMLFPCSVCTFHTLPKWGLFKDIDLLIVDEAGQATPQVAAAAFAKADRALVVGDTDQIEPVWDIPVDLDASNLRSCGLVDGGRDLAWWMSCGRAASGGNLMRLAQDACRYHQFPDLARGLYLTEHRRCRPSIVAYCNELVYRGRLEPRRPERAGLDGLPALGFVGVAGRSAVDRGSRMNDAEARAVAEWVRDWENRILARYGAKERADLRRLLAVVTPFKAQAKAIRRRMNSMGLPDVTVGTVHSLQGGEYEVVLFSSVYSAGDSVGTAFFDRAPNMLNVAVSRAKDHFVCFCDRGFFGKSPGTPSGQLRSLLAECG